MAHRKRFNPGFSRRTFFTGAGITLAAAPFVPLLESRAADGPPLRLVLLFSPNGTIHGDWLPQGGVDDFTLGPILAPLEPHHDDLVVIDGVRFLEGGAGNNHASGPSKFSCGSGLLPGTEFGGEIGWGSGRSIDQEYAAFAGQDTAFTSLEFGVRVGEANPRNRLSYADSNQPLAPENDPYAVFDRLFSEFGASAAEIEQRKLERTSVIDVVKSQLDQLHTEVAAADRIKIEAHLDGVRAIEARLALGNEFGESCTSPLLGEPLDPMAADNYPIISRLQMDLMVMAFACDLTRASTFMWSGSTSGQTFPWLGIADRHHTLSHEGEDNLEAQSSLSKINTWYAGEMAYLLDALAAIPEGDGRMLDNTIVLWGNELGRGRAHTHTRVPMVLAGGRNTGLETGRFLQFDDVASNRLLVSILNLLGVDVDTFGNLDDGTGGLPGL